ncbi:MAG: hypothetical protein V8R67_08775 [Eubacterium sp.]
MAKWNKMIYTEEGRKLLANAAAGACQVEFVRAAIGDGTYSEEEKTEQKLSLRTQLKNERNSYGFSSIKAEGNTAYLKVALQNTDVDTAYFISEIGVFARKKGSSEEAVLVLIAVAEIPDYFPEKSNAITIVQNIAIEFEDVKQLSIADDMGAYALVNTEYNVPDTLQSLVSGENMGTALGKLAKAVEELSQVKTKLETKPSYEEGVFSPSIMNGNIVPSLIQAEYKKVDRIVYIAIKFSFSTEIDTAQLGGILGLPFAVATGNATSGFYPLFARTTNGNYVGFVSYDNYMEQVPAISVSDLLRQQSTKVIRLYGQYEIVE